MTTCKFYCNSGKKNVLWKPYKMRSLIFVYTQSKRPIQSCIFIYKDRMVRAKTVFTLKEQLERSMPSLGHENICRHQGEKDSPEDDNEEYLKPGRDEGISGLAGPMNFSSDFDLWMYS